MILKVLIDVGLNSSSIETKIYYVGMIQTIQVKSIAEIT